MSNEINSNVPQSARVYDYWLGGKDNFPADRAMGDAIAGQLPTIRTQVRAQRAFLGRTVRFLAAEAGIHQFLDIAPIVLAPSRALIPGTHSGTVEFILADLREPEAILADPAVAKTLDLTQPVGLVLIGIMHHLRDQDDPRRIVATLVDALAPGSYLVLSQTTPDFDPEAMAGLAAVSEQGGIPNVPRTLADTEPFFAGLELVEPGLVPLAAWRPDPGTDQDPYRVYAYGGGARNSLAGAPGAGCAAVAAPPLVLGMGGSPAWGLAVGCVPKCSRGRGAPPVTNGPSPPPAPRD